MPLVTTTEMFKKAYDGGYAVGAFNVNNMEIVQGITEAAGELNVGLALVHTLNSRENMAWDDASLKDAIDGVKNHPGDLGMDRIAKLIFEQVNARLTLKDRTEYTTIPQNIMFADGTVTEIKEACLLYTSDAADDMQCRSRWSPYH